METDWRNIEYLVYGNETQQKAYNSIKQLKILEILKEYDPILVGTIPIAIDINGSDLDIICETYDFNEFEAIVRDKFSKYDKFEIRKLNDINGEVFVSNFFFGEFEFEIYAVALNTIKQNAYRHMLIEARILSLQSSKFREDIIKLKESGIKTEPAFARLLNLKGNPYEELLRLEDYSDEMINKLVL